MKKFPRAAIKIDFGTEVRLGPGKVRLLELIAETGSISAAARQMEMSYRRAWLLIDEVNGIFGNPVVETATGRNRRRRGQDHAAWRGGRCRVPRY